MAEDLDRRTYDLLRLIRDNEPIGSIRLVDLMQQRGYGIKGRTIRLMLSELDDASLTAKVPGKGRRLTPQGRAELGRGDIGSRLENVRERIATLTSQVTYDPAEGVGELVTCTVYLDRESLPAALDELSALASSPLGPVVAAAETEPDAARDVDGEDAEPVALHLPSSITLDGVLLSRGIDSELVTAGLVEYDPSSVAAVSPASDDANAASTASVADGEVVRYIDTLSGEGSTMDVVGLLVEAGRTDVTAALNGETGVLIVDNREIPFTRFSEARDLAVETTAHLGGVLDISRPREDGAFPRGNPGWDFASVTYGAIGEIGLALLFEGSLVDDWRTLSGLLPSGRFEPVSTLRTRLLEEDEGDANW